MSRKRFPAFVRLIRRRWGLTQSGLARELGVSEQTVWLWEAGRTKAREGHMALLVRALIGEVKK